MNSRQAILLVALVTLFPPTVRRGLAQEATQPQGSPTPAPASGETLTATAQELSVRSADGDFSLRLRALLQVDGRSHHGDQGVADGFLVRRARVELSGSFFERFDFRLMPELSGSPTLFDAWVRWTRSPGLQVQAGKVKQPVGLERAQSREHSLFAELGYPTALVPNRDIGVDVQGDLAKGRLSYYLGVFDGASDGASVASADTDDERELAARLLATPVPGLGLGIGGTYGDREGSAPSPYRTIGLEPFFRWRAGVVNDGTAWRAVPQGYFHRGPFLLFGEYAVSSQELRAGDAVQEVRATAWNASAAWVLTGDDATYRSGVVPERPVGHGSNRGAWQLAVRATALEVDDEAFPLFADPAEEAQKAETVGIALSWYANRVIRLSADFHHTELEGGPIEEEDVAILRAQLRF